MSAPATTGEDQTVDTHWWTRYPQLRQAELDALTEAGIGWEEEPLGEGSTVRVAGWVSIPDGSPLTARTRAADGTVRLHAVYPSGFPWFPPHLWDPDGTLGWLTRHVGADAADRMVCLIHDRDWQVGMTLADLLTRQLPALLRTGDPDAEQRYGRDELERWEMPLPDPAQNGVHVTAGWAILVDSTCQIPADIDSGQMTVKFRTDPLSSDPLSSDSLSATDNAVGCLVSVHAADERILTIDSTISSRYGHAVTARWLRLAAPPAGTATDVYAQIKDRLPTHEPIAGTSTSRPMSIRIVKPATGSDPEVSMTLNVDELSEETRAWLQQAAVQYQRRYAKNLGHIEVIGLYYPIESRWREPGWGWLFLLRLRTDRRKAWASFFVRPAYAGRSDLQLRVPQAEQLAAAKVLLVGVGAIGGRVADGLARAGIGELHLVDHDVVEPGNVSRHVAGLRDAGMHKAFAVAERVTEHSPLANVRAMALHVGSTVLTDAILNGHDWMLHAIGEASSLVVDAAADPTMSNYLSALCWAAQVPYVHVSATNGAWGGVVARIVPGRTAGCWACLAHHRADGTVPVPAADPTGNTLAPIGCVEPTFRGAAADLDTISLHAVRVITDTLAGSSGSGTLDADLHVATLRTVEGPVSAAWQTAVITVHPDCRQDHSSGAST